MLCMTVELAKLDNTRISGESSDPTVDQNKVGNSGSSSPRGANKVPSSRVGPCQHPKTSTQEAMENETMTTHPGRFRVHQHHSDATCARPTVNQ